MIIQSKEIIWSRFVSKKRAIYMYRFGCPYWQLTQISGDPFDIGFVLYILIGRYRSVFWQALPCHSGSPTDYIDIIYKKFPKQTWNNADELNLQLRWRGFHRLRGTDTREGRLRFLGHRELLENFFLRDVKLRTNIKYLPFRTDH